jgi:hypothetical protein
MVIRVNEVINTNIDGAMDSIVMRNRICKLLATSAGEVASSTPIVIRGTIWAFSCVIENKNNNIMNTFKNIFIVFPC